MKVVRRLLHFINVLNKELEQQAITDPLTNLYNRRYFEIVFSKAINSTKRNNELLCFIILDLDYFKQYNDTYGHQAGDLVLINVAKCLKKTFQRADDYCFRLGSEEFGILYRVENKDQAISFSNTIRQNIENLKIEHKKIVQLLMSRLLWDSFARKQMATALMKIKYIKKRMICSTRQKKWEEIEWCIK